MGSVETEYPNAVEQALAEIRSALNDLERRQAWLEQQLAYLLQSYLDLKHGKDYGSDPLPPR